MARKKLNWLLILQGWAMLWVVIGHAFLGKPGEGPMWENVLFHFAYSFHMPLFMLVSGWLFYCTRLHINNLTPVEGGKLWSWGKIVRDKAIRLLLPGLVFSIVALSLKIIFPGEISRKIGLSFSEIVYEYIYPYENALRELWFIVTLFWFFVLTPLWRIVLEKVETMWMVMALLIVFHFWHPQTQFLCIDRVFRFAIWFYMGIVFSKVIIVENWFQKQPWLTFIMGIILYTLGLYTSSFITTLGGITLSFGLALIFDKFIPQIFSSFRNYTYQIFLMGIFAQMFIKIIYKHLPTPYVIAYLICIAAGVYVPVLISKLIEKINWKLLSLCVGLRTR